MKLDFLKDCIETNDNILISSENDTETAIITNPYSSNDLIITFNQDGLQRYTVYFATDHQHIENEGKLIEYINSIICEERFIIQFYKYGKPSFGGNIKAKNLSEFSPQVISKWCGYSLEYLVGQNFKIFSWSADYDCDGSFVQDDDISIVLTKNISCKKTVSFSDMVDYEYYQMNPFQRNSTKYIAPVYIGISGVIVAIFALLMSIDEEKYLGLGIGLLFAFVLLSVAVCIYSSFTRKKVLSYEINRYDLRYNEIKDSDIYGFYIFDSMFLFDRYGMTVNGSKYSYNDLSVSIVTNNKYNNVNIIVLFYFYDPDSEKCVSAEIPLSARILKVIYRFGIKIENSVVLEAILNDPEKSFKKILNGRKLP